MKEIKTIALIIAFAATIMTGSAAAAKNSDMTINAQTTEQPAVTAIADEPDRARDVSDDTAATAEYKVFLVSVEPGTTRDMMNDVTGKYGLEIIYDYQNFNMYAVALPDAISASQAERFSRELLDNYPFILSVGADEPVHLCSDAE